MSESRREGGADTELADDATEPHEDATLEPVAGVGTRPR